MKVLFEDKEVQKLLDDYQKLIGVRIAVFDTSFNELYSSPKNLSSFCTHIRQNKHVNSACLYCDEKAFRQAKVNQDIYIYKCHLGLYEAVTPIFDNNQILGYVMIGQVLGEVNRDQQWKALSTIFTGNQSELDDSKKDYYVLKQMTIDQIESVSRIMKACASSIWLQHIIDIERSPITERIHNYIQVHCHETITTENICKDLKLSKTTIYNYLKSEYNLSLSGYVNFVRLQKAKELLLNTDISITSIANEVGFSDYNYFSRIFKQQYEKSPTQFRKN